MFKKTNWGMMLKALCLFVSCTKPDNSNNNESGGSKDTIVNPQVVVTTLSPVNITFTEAICGAKVSVFFTTITSIQTITTTHSSENRCGWCKI